MASGRETAAYGGPREMTDSQPIEATPLPTRHLQPRAPRQRTLIGGLLLRQAMAQQGIIIRNVSPHGLCAASRGTPREAMPLHGEIVCIRLPENREHLARVHWVEDHAFGVELFSALDVEALAAANRRRNAHFLQMLDPVVRPMAAHLSSI